MAKRFEADANSSERVDQFPKSKFGPEGTDLYYAGLTAWHSHFRQDFDWSPNPISSRYHPYNILLSYHNYKLVIFLKSNLYNDSKIIQI